MFGIIMQEKMVFLLSELQNWRSSGLKISSCKVTLKVQSIFRTFLASWITKFIIFRLTWSLEVKTGALERSVENSELMAFWNLCCIWKLAMHLKLSLCLCHLSAGIIKYRMRQNNSTIVFNSLKKDFWVP